MRTMRYFSLSIVYHLDECLFELRPYHRTSLIQVEVAPKGKGKKAPVVAADSDEEEDDDEDMEDEDDDEEDGMFP